MKIASALASGREALPELAAAAVEEALAKAGLCQAARVILLLTPDFARQPATALRAAARAAGCLQIAGGTASGLFTEREVLLDRPGAAALVFEKGSETSATPLLSLCAHSALPFGWRDGPARVGLLDAGAALWSAGRAAENASVELPLPGRIVLSTGLRPLGPVWQAAACTGQELGAAGEVAAAASLLRNLPAGLRAQVPLHSLAVWREDSAQGIAILSINADGSLTLAEPLPVGTPARWATRQPLGAEQEMRERLREAATGPAPLAGLMFSCIGRGPLFYGAEDRDRLAFCEQFPDLPLLGAYASGQIAPCGGENRLHQYAVATLLIEDEHV